MRRLVLPTCLFLAAWTHPTGPGFDFEAPDNTINVSVLNKTAAQALMASQQADLNNAPTPARPTAVSPAETTDQLIGLNTEPAMVTQQDAEREASTTPPVPMPPRRVIPHKLVCAELAVAAANNNVPAPFLIKLINQESGFNQNAVSPVGAQGVAQFMPQTAARMRLSDPFDPLQAVHASAQLLRNLLEQFGNKLGLAAAAYNAGPKRVQDWLSKRGKLPQETRDYVQRITGRNAEEWKGNTVAAQMRVPANAPCQREAGLYASNGPARIPLPPSHMDQAPTTVKFASHKIPNRKESRIQVASAGSMPPFLDQAPIVNLASRKGQRRQEIRIKIASAGPSTAVALHKHTSTPLAPKAKAATITIAAKRTSRSAKSKKVQVADAQARK